MSHQVHHLFHFFAVATVAGILLALAMLLFRMAVAATVRASANARLLLEDFFDEARGVVPTGRDPENTLGWLRDHVAREVRNHSLLSHRLLMSRRLINALDLRELLVIAPRRRHWRELLGPASGQLPLPVWHFLNRLQAVCPLPYADNISAESTLRFWVLDAARAKLITHDTSSIVNSCIEDARDSYKRAVRHGSCSADLDSLSFREGYMPEGGLLLAVAGDDKVDIPFGRFPNCTVRHPARPRKPSALEAYFHNALHTYSLQSAEDVQYSVYLLFGVRLKMRVVRRTLRSMYHAGLVCRQTRRGVHSFATSPLGDSFPKVHPLPPLELRDPRLAEPEPERPHTETFALLSLALEQAATPAAPDHFVFEDRPAAAATARGTNHGDSTSDERRNSPVNHITQPAVANSHHGYMLLKAMGATGLKLQRAAAEVLCFFEGDYLTAAALTNLLFSRTGYTMIAEVFEYDFACNVVAAARRLGDLEREALLLHSGVRPEELGRMASDAYESRSEAAAALYGPVDPDRHSYYDFEDDFEDEELAL